MKERTKEYIIELLRIELAQGKTQTQLAEMFGVKKQHIGELLKGTRNPGFKIYNALGLRRISGDSPGEYFYIQDERTRNTRTK